MSVDDPCGHPAVGVATGALGLAAETFRPWLGWAYAVYGLVLFTWLLWLAVALWTMGAQGARSRQ